MSDNMNFPIPNSVLEPYIKQAVSTSIVAALGDGTALVGKAIESALSQKVNYQGKISNYNSENIYNFVEVVAYEKICEVTKIAISEMAESMKENICHKVKELILQKYDEIAHVLVNGMIDSLKVSWNMNVSLSPKESKE